MAERENASAGCCGPKLDIAAVLPALAERARAVLGPGCCEETSDVKHLLPPLAGKASLFKALGDELRLKLLHLVRDDEVCVCDLVTLLGIPQGSLSHHLGILHQAGLVTARKQGRWNYYRATELARVPLAVFEDAPVPLPPPSSCD